MIRSFYILWLNCLMPVIDKMILFLDYFFIVLVSPGDPLDFQENEKFTRR